jgi:putative transposase
VLAATDFFTTEVWTIQELMTYYVPFVQLDTRKVHVTGITLFPNKGWMRQVARNVTMPDWGFLSGFRYLIHDRDTKFSDAFQAILKSVGLTPLPSHRCRTT